MSDQTSFNNTIQMEWNMYFKRYILNNDIVMCIVLKPGPAWRVDPGPSQPEPGTGPGLSKNPLESWPGETRLTQVNPAETRLPSFFFLYRFKRFVAL
jgi:hypothetical protein